MKIISKFHDYYDSALGFGHDPSIVYPRNTSEFSDVERQYEQIFNIIPKSFLIARRQIYIGEAAIVPFVVAFCAKLYTGFYVFDSRSAAGGAKFNPIEETFVYTDEQMMQFVEQSLIAKERKEFDKWYTQPYKSWSVRNSNYNVPRSFLERKNDPLVQDLLINQRVVVAIFGQSYKLFQLMMDFSIAMPQPWTTSKPFAFNDISLKDIQFYRAVDPYTAFQEIEMYLGGIVPRPGAMTANVEDKYRVEQHGFDKWSFRKMPQSKVDK